MASIDETAVQSLRPLSAVTVQRIHENSKTAHGRYGRAASLTFDQDERPTLGGAASFQSAGAQYVWQAYPVLWHPSSRLRTIDILVHGDAFDADVDLGVRVIPVSRITSLSPEPFGFQTVSPGTADVLFADVDVTEHVTENQPFLVYLYVRGKPFNTIPVEDGLGTSTLVGWTIPFAEFSGFGPGGWPDRRPHQILRLSNPTGGKGPTSGYLPFTRSILRREGNAPGSLSAYVWPPYAASSSPADLTPPNDLAEIVEYSSFAISSIMVREKSWSALPDKGSSLNSGQNPHIWPQRESYKIAEDVYRRGRCYGIALSPPRNFLSNGFGIPSGSDLVSRGVRSARPASPTTPTVIHEAVVSHVDAFYLGQGLQRFIRGDYEVMLLVGLSHVNSITREGVIAQNFEFTVRVTDRDGASNEYITDPVEASIEAMPISRGRNDPIEMSNAAAYLLGNFRTGGTFPGQDLDTRVCHGLSDALPSDVVREGIWNLIRLRVQDPNANAGTGIRRLQVRTEFGAGISFMPASRIMWHTMAACIVDTTLNRAIDGGGVVP